MPILTERSRIHQTHQGNCVTGQLMYGMNLTIKRQLGPTESNGVWHGWI